MFGWRARIGVISPSTLEHKAYEFYRLAPEGVGLVAVTCNINQLVGGEFDRVLAQAYPAAEYLAARDVDYIIHNGGPPVMSRGVGFDLELIAGIEDRAKVKATTTIRSAMDALVHLGCRRIAVASPYPDDVNAMITQFLAGNGFTVAKAANLQAAYKTLHTIPPENIYRLAGQVLAEVPDVDGLYMPCAEWPVCEMVPFMERDFGKPVVVNEYANFWKAFTDLGLRPSRGGHGRLLDGLGVDGG